MGVAGKLWRLGKAIITGDTNYKEPEVGIVESVKPVVPTVATPSKRETTIEEDIANMQAKNAAVKKKIKKVSVIK